MPKKSYLSILISLLVVYFFLDCAYAAMIDTSSDESLKSSLDQVRNDLPFDKRLQFEESLKVLAMNQVNFGSIIAQGNLGPNDIVDKIRKVLNGKTGEQIIAEASTIILERQKKGKEQQGDERERKEKEQALKEIAELEKKRHAALDAQDQLKRFEILRSRFYKRKREYAGDEPIIELSVKNGTTHPISRAYFKGTIASPGRSVPWFVKEFNYSIPGGLEPGESADWSLAPNMFMDWGKVNAPPDAILTVTVERLDGADGKAIFSTDDFSDKDEGRLDRLKKQYGTN